MILVEEVDQDYRAVRVVRVLIARTTDLSPRKWTRE